MAWNEASDDEDEDYTGFDTSDAEDETTAECPSCGELIYDDAERCPQCGEYLTTGDVAGRKPAWVIVGAVICLLIVLLWVLGGVF